MNYFKHFLEANEQQQQTDIKYSPQLSGDFEIVQWTDQYQKNDETNKTQNYESNNKNNNENKHMNNHDSNNDNKGQIGQKQLSNQQCEDLLSKSLQSSYEQYKIIQIDEVLQKQQYEKSLKNHLGSASTIKIDEYYMIVDRQEIKGRLQTKQQWQQFYKKIKQYETKNHLLNICSKIKIQRTQLKLCIKQLNSILQISCNNIQKRMEYWNRIAVSQSSVIFKNTQLCNKKDPQKLQKNVNKIINNLASQILYDIVQKNYRQIQNIQAQLESWKKSIIKLLTLYGANDKQIGYSKGIQYILLGIIVAKPFRSFFPSLQNQFNDSCTIQTQLESHFKYLMFTKQLRNMYFPGTPKLYEQIQKLEQLIKVEVSGLYAKLNEINADYMKIFINYYKTFMLYRLKNPFAIRKILQLLIIYGIDIVRILITRIMNLNQHKILQIKDEVTLLKFLAENLFVDYFQNGSQQQILENFKHLFILDVQL